MKFFHAWNLGLSSAWKRHLNSPPPTPTASNGVIRHLEVHICPILLVEVTLQFTIPCSISYFTISSLWCLGLVRFCVFYMPHGWTCLGEGLWNHLLRDRKFYYYDRPCRSLRRRLLDWKRMNWILLTLRYGSFLTGVCFVGKKRLSISGCSLSGSAEPVL